VVDERAELGRDHPLVRGDDEGAVVVVADPQVAEVGELHLDGALAAQDLEPAAAGAQTVEVAVQRGAVEAKLSVERALPAHDVEERGRLALALLLAELHGPLQDLVGQGAAGAGVLADCRSQGLDAALPKRLGPVIDRALGDPDRAGARQVVRLLGDAPDDPDDLTRRELVLVHERGDDAVAEQGDLDGALVVAPPGRVGHMGILANAAGACPRATMGIAGAA